MKLLRPHIPHSVRVEVALRQLRALGVIEADLYRTETRIVPYLERLLFMLQMHLNTTKTLELHHRPALVNREKVYASDGLGAPLIHIGYLPEANDPEHLFYVPEDQHDVETRVRGLRGQHSDLALVRKRKNIDRNREQQISPRGKKVSGKKMQSANRWPPKGSQKIKNRGFR